jgi:hypothetical protein
MKKIIWIVIILAIAGYFVNSYLDRRAKRQAEQAEEKRIEQITKLSVKNMVSKANAFDGWEGQLSKGERFRLSPILTVELEKVWVTNRPVLFMGTIKDIATQDGTNYMVLVERSLLNGINYMFDTELQLSLSSPKPLIDTFLKQHPNLFKNISLNNGIAVVAQIRRIRTAYVSGEEGQRDEVKIGEGELLDIVYTGDVLF